VSSTSGDAQTPRVRDGTPEHAAQDVAAPLVRRLNPVGDQEGRGACVLGDHLQRDVVERIAAVCATRHRLDHLQERAHQIGLEVTVGPLQHHRHALQRGAGVDVLRRQLAQHVLVRVDEVLHEDVVPDLHVALLVDVGPALGPVLGPAVHEDLAARAAGAGGVCRPVVVLVTAPHDAVRGDAEVPPDVERLVVGPVHRDPQAVELDAQALRHELEAPRARLGLEVVTEGEVAEHLEHREVPRGVAHILDVVGAEALLDGDGAMVGRVGLPQEVRDELVHAGVREQETGLGRRDQRRGRDAAMLSLLEERQEGLADPVTVHRRPV
jgi:hypothetical protein